MPKEEIVSDENQKTNFKEYLSNVFFTPLFGNGHETYDLYVKNEEANIKAKKHTKAFFSEMTTNDSEMVTMALKPPTSQSHYDETKMIPTNPLMANTLSSVKTSLEDVETLLKEICFEQVNEKIQVIIIAIDQIDPNNNHIVEILADGDPLGGYAYTSDSDEYIVNCCSYFSLGKIPIAFRYSMPGYSGKQIVPLPPSLIYKYASPMQRKYILSFQEQHKNCSFQYIQSLSRS